MACTDARAVHPFDAATAVVRDGVDRYHAHLDPAWSGTQGPHGGVLAATLLRAMRRSTEESAHQPQSLLVQYARAPVAGPASITVSVDRVGRRASQLSASLSQQGRECVRALATFTEPFDARDDDWSEPLPPLPAFASLTADVPAPWWPPFTAALEYRIALGGACFSGAEALSGGWVCPREPREVDALLIAYLADAWFPSPFVRLREAAAVPTLDLSVHFLAGLREPLAPAPLAARFATATARRGLFVEDGTFWTAAGTVIAQSRQSALRLDLE
jgi:hypothetical protein